MRILIISPYPPPIGGNSVHVQRLLSLLTDAGYSARVLDYKRKSRSPQPNVITLSPTFYIKLIELVKLRNTLQDNTLIHFHVSALGRFKWVAPILLMFFYNSPKVITIHSGSFTTRMDGVLQQTYLKFLLGYFKQIITVSDEQAQYLFSIGIAKGKVTTIPAFLPQESDPKLLPKQIKELANNRILVLTSGYLTPIYNYDVLIDCISQLDKTRYTFIFACYNETEIAYEQHIYERLSKYPNVIILRDQSPEVFVTIQARCDIYVRTTLTDGDAVAIREALENGKTVFATNCVKRPQGCYLFLDSTGLLELFQKHDNGAIVSKSNANSSSQFFEHILTVYRSALNSRKQS